MSHLCWWFTPELSLDYYHFKLLNLAIIQMDKRLLNLAIIQMHKMLNNLFFTVIVLIIIENELLLFLFFSSALVIHTKARGSFFFLTVTEKHSSTSFVISNPICLLPIFNSRICNYQTFTRWDLFNPWNYHLIECLLHFACWFWNRCYYSFSKKIS